MKVVLSYKNEHSRSTARSLKLGAIALAVAAALPSTSLAQEDSQASNKKGVIEEVVVTGSYLSRLRQSDLPSPTTVLGADFIGDIGAANVGDIIQNLTINAGSQNNPDAFTQNATVGTSNFNLRGLGCLLYTSPSPRD